MPWSFVLSISYLSLMCSQEISYLFLNLVLGRYVNLILLSGPGTLYLPICQRFWDHSPNGQKEWDTTEWLSTHAQKTPTQTWRLKPQAQAPSFIKKPLIKNYQVLVQQVILICWSSLPCRDLPLGNKWPEGTLKEQGSSISGFPAWRGKRCNTSSNTKIPLSFLQYHQEIESRKCKRTQRECWHSTRNTQTCN